MAFDVQWSMDGFPSNSVVKNTIANAGDAGDTDSISGSGRSSGGGNGNPFQYSCLKNSMDREAWQATVQRVAKELDMTDRLSIHACMHTTALNILQCYNIQINVHYTGDRYLTF